MAEAMQYKNAQNICIIDFRFLPPHLMDGFVICDASSPTQMLTICEYIQEKLKEKYAQKATHIEGLQGGLTEWIVMDYIDIVGHIFLPDIRKRYDLEGLWSDAKHISISNDSDIL